LKEVENQAKDKGLHGNSFGWLVNFCKTQPSDSMLLAGFRTHLRKELAILEALNQLDACKALATYAKKSGVNCKLVERLRNPPDTRWTGKCQMLRSVSQYLEVRKVIKRS